MATSGADDLVLNVRQVITSSLQKLNVYAPDDTPSAADMQTGRLELSLMLKGWQRKAPNLFRRSSGTVALVANTTAYVLDPRPYRVISARYRSADGRDIPMVEWTAEDYEDMPVKASTGTPVAWYCDYQREQVVMNVWQSLASVSGQTIRYTYQRRVEDVLTLDEDLDISQENFDLAIFSLADRLAPAFGRSGSAAHANVKAEAMSLMAEAMADDREAVVRFVPSNG
jgi:hypothetical protein